MNETDVAKNIDTFIAAQPAWQKDNLSLFRKLVHAAEPGIQEDWKWNVPVFVLSGKIIFAMSGFKDHTKYNFILNGALLQDKNHLFNNGLESKKSRGIDLKETDKIDETKLTALIRESLQAAKQ